MKKVCIADDEAAGRKLIREYLTEHPELMLIGEANNGVDAVKLINEYRPDLVFMDVQMPGLNGFEVLGRLKELPMVIFSTAYDKYAIKAFEVHALDYLLKPYTRERFNQAIARLHAAGNPMDALVPFAEKLIMDQARFPERILVQSGRKMITISVADIYRIEAMGDYSRLHTPGQVYTSNYGISQLTEKLNPEHFIRVHRSSVIHIGAVREVNRYPGSYDVVLHNGDVVSVSRSYMENLKRLMF